MAKTPLTREQYRQQQAQPVEPKTPDQTAEVPRTTRQQPKVGLKEKILQRRPTFKTPSHLKAALSDETPQTRVKPPEEPAIKRLKKRLNWAMLIVLILIVMVYLILLFL